MDELLIRVAGDADIEDILRLYRESGIEADKAFTVDEAREHLKQFARYPNYKVYVGVLGGAIVGTYALLVMDNLAKRGRRSAIAEDVAVSPDHQGKGIGRAMMAHAMQMSTDAGCYKLVLSSGLRRSGAHDFYETVGFEQHGLSFRVALSQA